MRLGGLVYASFPFRGDPDRAGSFFHIIIMSLPRGRHIPAVQLLAQEKTVYQPVGGNALLPPPVLFRKVPNTRDLLSFLV